MRIFKLEHNKGDNGKVRIVDPENWKNEAPHKVYKVAENAYKEGVPSLIGYHEDYGSYVRSRSIYSVC